MSKIKPLLILSSMVTGIATPVICLTSCNQSTTYVIKWLNWDGSVLKEDEVKKGEKPEYKGLTPTRPDDKGTRYTFSKWSPDIVAANENTSYTAQFSESVATYTINFVNYDGSVLQTNSYHYNDPVSYSGPTPTKPDDHGTRFTFKGWDQTITAAVKDEDYIAQYNEGIATYTITFKNYDGSTLQSKTYNYGDKVVYEKAIPTKPSDTTGAYQFTGWGEDVTSAQCDKEYVAQFKTYAGARRVKFINYDGTILQDGFPLIGSIPTFVYDTIKGKEYDDGSIDVFMGWDKPISPVSDDTEYVAQFEKQTITDTVLTVDSTGETNTQINFVVNNNNTAWTVDWDDGNVENFGAGTTHVDHTYPIGTQQYNIKIKANKNITSLTFERSYQTPDTNERIKGISLSNSIRTIDRYAFRDCDGLAGTVNIPNNIFKINECAFLGCDQITAVKMPPYMKLIDRSAFQGCAGITNLDLGGTQEVGQSGFSNCSFTSLHIPATLFAFNNWSFYACKQIETITVDSSNPLYDSRNNCNAIIETKTNTLLKGCLGTSIPDSVMSIGQAAFQFFETMTSISIPNSVSRIEESAFSYCHALTGVILPSNLTYIGDNAFSNCENISSIIIPSLVTEIGEEAFYRCADNLVVDLSNVDHLVTGHSGMFHKTSTEVLPNLVIKVPTSLLSRYQVATGWSSYKNYMQGI